MKRRSLELVERLAGWHLEIFEVRNRQRREYLKTLTVVYLLQHRITSSIRAFICNITIITFGLEIRNYLT